MAEFTESFVVSKQFDGLIRTYQYTISVGLPTFAIVCITVTIFFCILYQIFCGLFFWFVEMRPIQHDLEEGTRPAAYGALVPSHQVATIFQDLVYSLRVAAAFEDEKEGKKLRASKKLPPLVNYGSHDIQRSSGECAICLEDFEVGQSCQVFPVCTHIFHSDCIDRWLQKKLTCPICRISI